MLQAVGAGNRPDRLGLLLEAFMNRVAHPRGRALKLMADANVTVPQAILMTSALAAPSTPSGLAAAMKISLSSASQMIERLAKFGYLSRAEDGEDRRRKRVAVTPKGRAFLKKLKAARVGEFEAGVAALVPETRRLLAAAITRALSELDAAAAAEPPLVIEDGGRG